MTADNSKWEYEALEIGIEHLRIAAKNMRLDKLPAWQIAPIIHTIDFIEYNMQEMEIKPSVNNE